MIDIEAWELLLLPIYIGIILAISFFIKGRNIRLQPEYKYYIPGLMAKIAGGVAFACIYLFYYHGGDTTTYYQCSVSMVNLLMERPLDFLQVFFTQTSSENLSLFDSKTGYVWAFMYYDIKTFTVIRFVTPFVAIAFKSYLLGTVLIAWVCYIGIWKVYLLFGNYYPVLRKKLAIAFLFLPSALLWGSGIAKDSITLSAVCWLVFACHQLFIAKKYNLANMVCFFIALYLIFSIKPYAIYALAPGMVIWLFHDRIQRIKSNAFRRLVMPLIFLLFIGIGGFSFYAFGDMLVDTKIIDEQLERAAVIQDDLKQSYYGGNSFDIGSFEPTASGVLSKLPIAVVSGLFRPFIWEGNMITLFAAIESSILLVLFFVGVLKSRVLGIFGYLAGHPVFLFFISYSLILAFIVGLTTSNFGALVRFKITFLPFFVGGVFILMYLSKQRKSGVFT
ncbi:MAG: hypothetical protein COA57_00960 [Flavobacteriales bacterium]|nr:MAG: hypothetical protein COA57_00960 [Flavobacteriales bacterium]